MFRKVNLHIKTTVVIFAALIVLNLSLSQLRAQSNYGQRSFEELYKKCLSFSLWNLCNFLFGKNSEVNMSNSTDLANFSALTYNDKDFGFIIHYPLGWTVDQNGKEFSTVVRFAPPQNDADVDIRIYPKGDYKTIDEYGDTFKESNNHYKLLNYYRNSSTTLSDRQAVRAIYLTSYNASITENTSGNKSNLKEMMVATMVPERESIYAIAYFTEPPNFDNYRSVVEKMIDSFQIYGKKPNIIQEGNSR